MPTTTATAKTVSVRSPDAPANDSALQVTSTAFRDGGKIALRHVFNHCGGENVSPQLAWSGAPDGTKSFAITCFDPDAPTGSGYWHWVAFDIPASVTSLQEGAGTGNVGGGTNGFTDFGLSQFCGPCPPPGDGDHRYTFTVYALDVPSVKGASDKTTGATLVFSIRGHVLGQGSITGTFGH
jgi:Raf kinase inhibitor-like YbhB/YbcL family protein